MFEIIDQAMEDGAVIKIIGVGGCGGNAVEHMIERGLTGVDFICANTDAQALKRSTARTQLQLGATLTRGLGAGARPEIGRDAAQLVRRGDAKGYPAGQLANVVRCTGERHGRMQRERQRATRGCRVQDADAVRAGRVSHDHAGAECARFAEVGDQGREHVVGYGEDHQIGVAYDILGPPVHRVR